MDGQQTIDLEDVGPEYTVDSEALTLQGMAERTGELEAERRVRELTTGSPYAGKVRRRAWQRGFDRVLHRYLGLTQRAIERHLKTGP